MATITLSRNLKLKISSDLTADAKYNLERIDSLAASLLPSANAATIFRAIGDIQFQPNSPDIGGSGSGGQVNFGSPDQPLSTLAFHSDSVSFSSSLGLGDVATGGNKKLYLKYKSDISGSVDTTADRNLYLDLQGADRQMTLGANFQMLGPHSLSLSTSSPLSLTLPNGYGTIGQVLMTDGTGGLSWTDVVGSGTTLPSLTDVTITSPAAGEYLMWDTVTNQWINKKPYYSVNWIPGDGVSKFISHNLNTYKVIVQVYDENYKLIDVADIDATSPNDVTLESSQAPSGTWSVHIYAIY